MITERTTGRGITFLDMETPLCSASLCLQGAHLTSWKPAGQEECLFLSSNAVFAPGKAIRGGIPVCWPWFGPRENAPSHGVARTSEWRIHHQDMDARGSILLSLALYPMDEELPAAILRLKLGSTLSMKLETTVRKHPCTLTEAFHNYLLIGDLAQCRVRGLEHVPFKEDADPPIRHGEHPLAPKGWLDRTYYCPASSGAVILEDPVMSRTITVEREQASSMIVWNPGRQGAASMTDLGEEQWNRFLCVETGNAAPNGIALSPGHAHTLYQKISIGRLV